MTSEKVNCRESLGTFLSKKIAEVDGINPEDVTVAYIHEQREKRFYPDTRYDAPQGLVSLTRNELDKLEESIDKVISLY